MKFARCDFLYDFTKVIIILQTIYLAEPKHAEFRIWKMNYIHITIYIHIKIMLTLPFLDTEMV